MLSRELAKSQHISLTEFNELPPWRLHIYLELIQQEIEREKLERIKQKSKLPF